MNYANLTKEQLLVELAQLQDNISHLEKSEKSKIFYDTILNNMGDPVFVKDDQSRLLLMNDAFCEIFNLTRAEIIGKTLAEEVNPEEQELFLKIDQEVILTGQENITEETLTVRGGKSKTISTRKTRFSDKNGNHFLVGVIRDITERKQAEEALKLSEQKFKDQVNFLDTIINYSPFAMWISKADGTLIRSNHALRTILNVTDEQIIGKYNVLKDENLTEQGFSASVKAVYEDLQPARFVMYWTGEKVGGEFDYTNAKPLWIDVSMFPIIGENEKLLNVVCQYVDITENKQAEEELFQSLQREQTLADIVRESPVAIAFGYPDGSLDNCNKAFTDLTGYAETELKEINWNEVLTPSKWNDIEAEELTKLNPENNIVRYEKEYIHKDGSIIPIELVVTAKFDSENNLIHFIGFVSDITELKKHREHLEELVRERTEDLQKKNKELDAAMKVFVGRELTIRELQKRIKALGGEI